MKKIVTLVALSIIMTGCVSSGKVSVKREQLEHHRFVLESVNGKTVTGPELSFGEDMTVSGKNVQSIHRRRKTIGRRIKSEKFSDDPNDVRRSAA